ncbi:MAG: hypothetical protein IJM57_09115 [Lachnospiraceae bacterium]|nr:hypothetical protein [Lachnospiraceae bacterium]
MDCKRAQKLSEQYISGNLPQEELPEYLSHIKSCPVCRESLVTDYSIATAIEQLNKGEDFSVDYSNEISQKLIRSSQFLVHKRRLLYVKRVVIAALLIVVLVLVVGSATKKTWYYLPENSTESLRLKHYGIPQDYDPVWVEISELNNEAVAKLRELASLGGIPDE